MHIIFAVPKKGKISKFFTRRIDKFSGNKLDDERSSKKS